MKSRRKPAPSQWEDDDDTTQNSCSCCRLLPHCWCPPLRRRPNVEAAVLRDGGAGRPPAEAPVLRHRGARSHPAIIINNAAIIPMVTGATTGGATAIAVLIRAGNCRRTASTCGSAAERRIRDQGSDRVGGAPSRRSMLA